MDDRETLAMLTEARRRACEVAEAVADMAERAGAGTAERGRCRALAGQLAYVLEALDVMAAVTAHNAA